MTTWAPNGLGVLFLSPVPLGVLAAVEDHIDHAVGVLVYGGKTVRTSGEIHHNINDAKAWCEARVGAMGGCDG